jgi:hypothetical protein
MSTPLTRQNDNVLNALNEGRLQGRLEALEEVSEKCAQLGFATYKDTIEFQKLLAKAKEEYNKWFE